MAMVAVNLTRPPEELGEIPARLHAAGFQLRCGSGRRATLVADVISSLSGCVAAIAGQELYTAEVFDACPELRLVVRLGVGFDTVDVKAATQRGVLIATIPGTDHPGYRPSRVPTIPVPPTGASRSRGRIDDRPGARDLPARPGHASRRVAAAAGR
jgi:D-isomer specific 2-hydroxyacid dehydrogenase, catalytic domain